MPGLDRRLFFALDSDGNLKLGGPWALAELKGIATRGTVTVSTTAGLIIPANPARKGLILYVNSTNHLFLGETDDVTTSGTTAGFPVLSNDYFTDDLTLGAWYGVSTGSCNVRYIEVVFDEES